MSYLELARLALPEIIVVVTALAVLALGLISQRVKGFCAGVGAAGLLFAMAGVLTLPHEATLLQGMLVISPLTSLFKLICLVLAFCAVLLTEGEQSLPNKGEYVALFLLATVGLLLLVGSEELLVIFIGLELTGLSLYVLTAFDREARSSAEAGLKYFLFGSMASAFTLFGLSLLYGFCGTTSLAAMAPKLAAPNLPPLLYLGMIMTLLGFAFKVAAAPFHLWAPDTYQGAPVSTAALVASGSKVAAFFVLGKIVLIGFAPLPGSAAWHGMNVGWTPLLAAIAALSILLGNLLALVQKNVRRLLAYSAVAHAGYTLLGLVATGRDGFAATLFYTTVYAFTLLGAFGVVAVVRRETGGDDLTDFAGLRARSPVLALCWAVFLLSLAGLPPLAGFFGKFYLFSAALRAGGNHGLLWLVVLGLFGSLISLYYYLILLKVVFVDAPVAGARPAGARVRPVQELIVSVLAALVLLFGLWPAALVAPIVAALR